MKKEILVIIPFFFGTMIFGDSSTAQAPKLKGVKNIPAVHSPIGKAVKWDKKNYTGSEKINFVPAKKGNQNGVHPPSVLAPTETVLGQTTYDLQSNSTVRRQIVINNDNTASAVWTFGTAMTSGWPERGTGYNFFNGTAWGTAPSARQEASQRTGWCNIGTTNAGNEVVVAHPGTGGLHQLRRNTIGSGSWNEAINVESSIGLDILWPRMAVGGANGQTLHVIAITAPTGNGGQLYQGLDGAIVYYRSQDAGLTWDIMDYVIPGLDTPYFSFHQADGYSIDANGDVVAIVEFGDVSDVVLMKSTDNGNTWSKTTVNDFADPDYDPAANDSTGITDITNDGIPDTIESGDGSGALIIDNNGIVHVSYGHMFYLDDTPGDSQWSFFPGTNGLFYWNENFGNNPPVIITGVFDLNNNGTLDVVNNDWGTLALYYVSLSGMPSMAVDSGNCIYVSYSGYMETLDDGSQNYRHVYIMQSCDGGCTWNTPVDVTAADDFGECVFASLAPRNFAANLQFVYQKDAAPGLAVRGDQDPIGVNDIIHVSVPVTDFNTPVFADSVCPPFGIASFDVADTKCNGSCDGEATVNLSGGILPYTFLWNDPGSQATQTATGLCSGTYTVIVADAIGGADTGTVTIGEPVALLATATSTDDLCSAQTGTATVTATGGTTPYNYLWSDSSSNATATGLGGGAYDVVVTDANSCTASTSVTVGSTPQVQATITTIDANCGAADGSATATVTSGTAPYSYTWNTTPAQLSSTATGLSIGVYQVDITDSVGCTLSDNATIINPNAPTLSVSSTDALCNGDATGTATVGITGGTAPYGYIWSDGQNGVTTSSATATGLAAGTYTVTVSGSDTCASAATVTISEPAALVTSTTKVDANCAGSLDGSVNLTVSGGTPTYAYAWSNSAATEDLSGVGKGDYYVTVTDGNGCIKTDSASVTEPLPVSGTTVVTDVSCNGGNDGAIDLTAAGGDGSYSYAWSGGAGSMADPMNLTAQSYTVTITDGNSCTGTASATVTEPTLLTVVLDAITNGQVLITAGGGTPNYSYLWTGGSTVEDPVLSSGTYTVTVTDANGCTATLLVVGINEIQVKGGFGIYPNPSKGIFDVKIINNSGNEFVMEIKNVLGQQVYSETINSSGNISRKIDLTNYGVGVYMLELKTPNGMRVERIVVY